MTEEVEQTVEKTCRARYVDGRRTPSMVVVFRIRWWKDEFMSMLNSNSTRFLMMGVGSSPVSVPGSFGNE